MTPLERYFRELLSGERIRALAAELLRIEDATPKTDRLRIRMAVNHLTRAADRLPANTPASVEAPETEGQKEILCPTDLERMLRRSIDYIRGQRAKPSDNDDGDEPRGGLTMEGRIE